MQILPLEHNERDEALLGKLTEIWESSVRATHDFLSVSDIERLRPQVREALERIPFLLVCLKPDSEVAQPAGFLGVDGRKIEMLFVDGAARGSGTGSLLIRNAVESTGACEVDVNEQNPQAVGFYEHLGFRVFARSDTDGEGRPFPILHMRREQNRFGLGHVSDFSNN